MKKHKKHKKNKKFIKKKMEEILDKSLEKYVSKDERVFANISLQKKFYHDGLEYKAKKWKMERVCMYPQCTRKSIVNSHTIQRSSSLLSISEDNHVLSPVFNHKNGHLHMKSIGIKQDASTFPGFCEEHEKIFNFEQCKELTMPEHYILQLFRTVCREIVANSLMVEYFNKQITDYKQLQDSVIKDLIIDEMKSQNVDYPLVSVKLENNDDIMFILKKLLNRYERIRAELINDFYKPFEDYFVKNIDIQSALKIVVTELDLEVPLCLAGLAGIGEIKGQFFINVLPYNGKTILITASLKKHANTLEKYVNYITQNGLSILTAVESWMVHGTDHWFIKPSVWNRLQKDKKEQILSDIFDIRYNILSPYSYSIFDEIRQDLLSLYKKKFKVLILNENEQKEAEMFLNIEEGKLQFINQKSVFDKRELILKHFLQ